MKPWKARKLTTDCDLSHCALDDANDMLVKHLTENGFSRDSFRSVLNVAVDADDFVRIIDLARVWNFRLQLKQKYEWDEWSVTYGIKGQEGFCIWSGGA